MSQSENGVESTNGSSSPRPSEPFPENPTPDEDVWAGLLASHVVAEEQAVQWRLGPLWLQATRRAREWSLQWRCESDPLMPHLEVIGPSEPVCDEEASLARFGFGVAPEVVQLEPRLSDRPVVVRPENPFSVLAEETVSIYVSTPLWFVVHVGEPGRELMEQPSFRPSDTWFGPTPMEGELCYAGRTEARLVLENLDDTLSRAVTPIQIQNHSDKPLEVARLNVPIPHLTLYRPPGNRLWTEGLTVVHRSGTVLEDVKITHQVPTELESAERIAEARTDAQDNLFFRVFSKLRI